MLSKAAKLFGIVFILVGILGFVPGVTNNEMLLGIFHVNAIHNFVHIISGVAAFLASTKGEDMSRMFFKVFGVIYGVVAILGLMGGDQPVLGMISNNAADSYLHIVIAAVSLYLGFGCCKGKCAAT